MTHHADDAPKPEKVRRRGETTGGHVPKPAPTHHAGRAAARGRYAALQSKKKAIKPARRFPVAADDVALRVMRVPAFAFAAVTPGALDAMNPYGAANDSGFDDDFSPLSNYLSPCP